MIIYHIVLVIISILNFFFFSFFLIFFKNKSFGSLGNGASSLYNANPSLISTTVILNNQIIYQISTSYFTCALFGPNISCYSIPNNDLSVCSGHGKIFIKKILIF
jgi:hypothetical protein